MKRLFSMMLAIVLFVSATFSISFSAVADEESNLGIRLKTSDTYYYYDESTKTLHINGKGDIPNLSNSTSSIPWLEWPADKIEHVVVAEGITSLGNYVFYSVGAKTFSLPRSIKRIGRYALASTYGATELNIPFGVETIDSYAFYRSSFTSINLPKTLKTIGANAFSGCKKFNSITIPASVTTISSTAFNGCSGLENLTFASLCQSVSIATNAFIGCSALNSVAMPQYASCATNSIGYISAGSLNPSFSMQVYQNSPAHLYAIGNGIPYTLLDTIPIECGVEYTNEFTSDTVDLKHHYTFTPSVSQSYVFYSTGECDTNAQLLNGSTLIAENDDIDVSHNGFSITASLTAGVTYDLLVGSGRMTMSYSLFVYPTALTNVSVYNGNVSLNASQGVIRDGIRVFNITKTHMQDFVFDLTFYDGTIDTISFDDYIAGRLVSVTDNQMTNPYVCGSNPAMLSVGELSCSFNVNINHSYTSKTVAPTEDEDGYDLYTCIICGDNYRNNYVPTTAITVTGRCVMDEDRFGKHELDVPYPYAYITVDKRRYEINPDGTWEIHTFTNCNAVFHNSYGGNVTISVNVDNGDYDYGIIPLECYDLNADGYVNAKDYAIYYKTMRDSLGEDYWQFGNEYIIKYN